MPEKNKWWAGMLERYETEEAVREHMRSIANRSARNTNGAGGFAALKQENPELLKERQRTGGQHRWINRKKSK